MEDTLIVANVVLIAPEIPQNTGNIIRLCANAGARLHLVKPLGFSLDEALVRRASLDYRDMTDLTVHDSFDSVLSILNIDRMYATVPDGPILYDTTNYQLNDTIIFGSESAGLPSDVVRRLPASSHIRIPMMPSNRSLNLSNSVAIIVYEIWRQLSYVGDKGAFR